MTENKTGKVIPTFLMSKPKATTCNTLSLLCCSGEKDQKTTGRETPAFHRVVKDGSLRRRYRARSNTKLQEDYSRQREAKCKDPRAGKSLAGPSHETEPRLER